jgi:hypothetical protein
LLDDDGATRLLAVAVDIPEDAEVMKSIALSLLEQPWTT